MLFSIFLQKHLHNLLLSPDPIPKHFFIINLTVNPFNYQQLVGNYMRVTSFYLH